MQASRQNMNFVYLQKTKILILHLVAIKTIFNLATKFRNIMNDLQTQFEHSMFNSDWQDETFLFSMVTNPPSNKNICFIGQEVFVYQI